MRETAYAARPGSADADDAPRLRLRLASGFALAAAAVAAVVIAHSGGHSAPVADGATSSFAYRAVAASSPGTGPATVPPTYTAVAPFGHDPFKPLVVAPVDVPTVARSLSPSLSPTQTPTPIVIVLQPTPTPTPTPTTSPTASVTVTATPSPTGLPTAGAAITLTVDKVDVANGTVDATVVQGSTSTPYTALKPGQVFGQYFKLVSVLSSDPSSPPVVGSADFEYGDQFVELGDGETAQLG